MASTDWTPISKNKQDTRILPDRVENVWFLTTTENLAISREYPLSVRRQFWPERQPQK
jgi:hypothetical protein